MRERAATGNIRNIDLLIKEKLEKGELIGSSSEFDSMMADLKRDNGLCAFYYDMFQMALTNLLESLQIRSDDPYAHYYIGKVLSQTARNRAEKTQMLEAFVKAIELDQRGILAEPWLYRALAMMADGNLSQKSDDIVNYLKKYVEIYQQQHNGILPPNMDAIYTYLGNLGEKKWVARPGVSK